MLPLDAVRRLVELTERETALLESLDLDALGALHDERDGAADAARAAPAGPRGRRAGRSPARRLGGQRARGATPGGRASAQRLGHIGSGRRAINAYAPGGAAADTARPRVAGPGGLTWRTRISFSGLGSGVDTNSIVEELIRLERVPITNVQTRQDREKTKQQALQDIASRLSTLRSNAEALTSVPFWNGVPHGTSGDEDSYSVTANAAAAKASYSVKVLSLAKADVHVQTATAGIRQFGAAQLRRRDVRVASRRR